MFPVPRPLGQFFKPDGIIVRSEKVIADRGCDFEDQARMRGGGTSGAALLVVRWSSSSARIAIADQAVRLAREQALGRGLERELDEGESGVLAEHVV